MDRAVLKVPVSEAAQKGHRNRADLGQNHNADDFAPFYVAKRTVFSLESGRQQCKVQPGTLLGAGVNLGWRSSWQAVEWREEMSQGAGGDLFALSLQTEFYLTR